LTPSSVVVSVERLADLLPSDVRALRREPCVGSDGQPPLFLEGRHRFIVKLERVLGADRAGNREKGQGRNTDHRSRDHPASFDESPAVSRIPIPHHVPPSTEREAEYTFP
jgi:hypothetical protein